MLITESVVQDAIAKGKKTLDVPRNAIITPLANELAVSKGIRFVQTESQVISSSAPVKTAENISAKGKTVAFGSDHGGFQLKEQLKKLAESLGYTVIDLGTKDENPCDYPDFAYAVARAVASGEAWRGVMIDGAGIGSCVVANKVPGVKAACCHNEFVARNAREHNDTNLLTLGSRVTGSEVCKEILRVWLETPFAGGRHKQRVDKIDEVEKRFLK
ncbi:MAG: ribose 5-phosphate isomerase B [Ignavibacteriae bacterium]|nr:ribose 5-phosphate isomerase B [Ignavibacteriota bacterium]